MKKYMKDPGPKTDATETAAPPAEGENAESTPDTNTAGAAEE